MAVQTTRTLPPQFIEDIGTDLAKQLVAQTGVPTVAPGAGGITQLAGEDADQFAARQKAAQQFDIRQQSIAGLAPTVASQDRLQTQAQTLAEQGIGSYQPFVTAAQNLAPTTGAQATQITQDFMSPYQSQVIDTTLAEFDRNAAIQQQRIRDNKQLWVRSAVVERECNSQSLAQGQQENVHYYKQDFCNKDLIKHKALHNKHFKTKQD